MDIMHYIKFKKYILVIAGFSYLTNSSGTSKVVKAHEGIFLEKGIDYIAVYPMNPKRIYSACYGVDINGESIGLRTLREVLHLISEIDMHGCAAIGVLIHHLLNHRLSSLRPILNLYRDIPIRIYLHDFYTCCVNYNLLRNNEQFCAESGVNCQGCRFAVQQKPHFEEMKKLFGDYEKQITFVAPAEFTKEIWLKFYPQYKNKVIVISHLVEREHYFGNVNPIVANEPLKIGFIGAQSKIKGWGIYKELIKKCRENGNNYQFYYFGNPLEQIDGVINTTVQIHLQGKNAMINALRDNNIDIVVLPAIWPETYSYTLYEALATNCFILTIQSSGNIAYVVEHGGQGLVCEDSEELYLCACVEDKLRRVVNAWRGTKLGALYYDDNSDIVLEYDLDNVYSINKEVAAEHYYMLLWRKLIELAYKVKEWRDCIK